MYVLVACEESQRVYKAFRNKGQTTSFRDAYTCSKKFEGVAAAMAVQLS